MPQRKIVRFFFFFLPFLWKWIEISEIWLGMCVWFSQIFTNADKDHAAKVLSRLGLDDCFEGVICFETLNPPPQPAEDFLDHDNEKILLPGDEAGTSSDGSNTSLSSKSRILCKPSVEAIEAAIRIANVEPSKTVNPTEIYHPKGICLTQIAICAFYSSSKA